MWRLCARQADSRPFPVIYDGSIQDFIGSRTQRCVRVNEDRDLWWHAVLCDVHRLQVSILRVAPDEEQVRNLRQVRAICKFGGKLDRQSNQGTLMQQQWRVQVDQVCQVLR